MICPICLQGEILKTKAKKTGKIIYICNECDSVWTDKIDENYVTNFDDYAKKENISNSWDELELLDK